MVCQLVVEGGGCLLECLELRKPSRAATFPTRDVTVHKCYLSRAGFDPSIYDNVIASLFPANG